MKISIDGVLVDGPEARIPVLDHGLLYGDGVFEGIRIYGGAVFKLEAHLRRLSVSARVLGLELPGGLAAPRATLLATARAFGEPEAYARLIVTRGDGPLGVDPTSCPRPRTICIVDRMGLFPQEKVARGLEMITSSVRRPPPDALEPRVKSLNYLGSVLAKQEARRQGADEALLLNAAGAVAEASVANVFVVRDGRLSTPPASDGALEGITRGSVLELAARLEIPARECTLGRIDVLGADEVFLTGTGARIVPVRSLDGRVIGTGGAGPVTTRLQTAFAGYVKEFATPWA